VGDSGHTEAGEGSRRKAPDQGGRVTIYASSAVLSTVAGIATSLATGYVRGDDVGHRIDSRIEAKLAPAREAMLLEVQRLYVSKEVHDTRWAMIGQNIENELRRIQSELSALREQTREVPKMAAKLELLERETGK
jgi:hypothetical protein